MKNKVRVFWFRRDMRLEDNVGLYHALSGIFASCTALYFSTKIVLTNFKKTMLE